MRLALSRRCIPPGRPRSIHDPGSATGGSDDQVRDKWRVRNTVACSPGRRRDGTVSGASCWSSLARYRRPGGVAAMVANRILPRRPWSARQGRVRRAGARLANAEPVAGRRRQDTALPLRLGAPCRVPNPCVGWVDARLVAFRRRAPPHDHTWSDRYLLNGVDVPAVALLALVRTTPVVVVLGRAPRLTPRSSLRRAGQRCGYQERRPP
jgi:hypothetical protein